MQNRDQRRRVRRGLDYQMPREGSELHQIYMQNSEESPLLRLPAEIRLAIFELVLTVGQISVDHAWRHKIRDVELVRNTRRYVFKTGKPSASGFYCYTMGAEVNPFTILLPPAGQQSGGVGRGVTLLSGVCRQLYLETALLPYKLNSWSFQHTMVLNRFLKERRLPRLQRRTIRTLYVLQCPLRSELINYFGGLKRVRIWDGVFKYMRDQQLPKGKALEEAVTKDKESRRRRDAASVPVAG